MIFHIEIHRALQVGVYDTLVSGTAVYLFSTLYVEYLINKKPESLTMRDWCSSRECGSSNGWWSGSNSSSWVGMGHLGDCSSGENGRDAGFFKAVSLWISDQLLEGAEDGYSFSMLLFLNEAS